MDYFLPITLLIIGLLVGAGACWFVMQSQLLHVSDKVRTDASTEVSPLKANVSHLESEIQQIKQQVLDNKTEFVSLQEEIASLKEKETHLETSIQQVREQTQEKLENLHEAQVKLSNTFESLSSDAIKSKNELFLAKEEIVRVATVEKKTADTLVLVAADRDTKELARKDAEDSLKYLGEVFQSPDPARDGRTITVAEILDKASEKLEKDRTTQPAKRASQQAILGKIYLAFGLYQQAIPLLEEVQDYHLTTSKHFDIHVAMIYLANAYYAADQRDEALKLREKLRSLCEKRYGKKHSMTVSMMYNLAISYFDADRQDEALKLREKVLTLRMEQLGPEDSKTLSAMYSLAISYYEADRRDEALKLREKVLSLRMEQLGPEHSKTFSAMSELAISYFEADRQDEALKLREKVLSLRMEQLGPEHSKTLSAKSDLASSFDAGSQDEAITLREEVLMMRRKLFGTEHLDTISTMNTLASSYVAACRTAESISLLPEDTRLAMIVAVLQAWFNYNAEHTATSERMLKCASDSVKSDEIERVVKLTCLRPITDDKMRKTALVLARRAVELGTKNKNTQPWYLVTLGMAEFRNGQYTEANNTLIAVKAAIDTNNDDDRDWIEGIANYYRVMSILEQGKTEEAHTLFANTAEKMKPRPTDNNKPLENDANHNDLILWLAFKEASAFVECKELEQSLVPTIIKENSDAEKSN